VVPSVPAHVSIIDRTRLGRRFHRPWNWLVELTVKYRDGLSKFPGFMHMIQNTRIRMVGRPLSVSRDGGGSVRPVGDGTRHHNRYGGGAIVGTSTFLQALPIHTASALHISALPHTRHHRPIWSIWTLTKSLKLRTRLCKNCWQLGSLGEFLDR